MTINPTDGPIHTWFSLSYCNYVVLHRTFLQSMPIEFQERIVACLEELQAAFAHIPQPEVFDVKAATEHIVNEMTDEQLEEAGIEADWYDEPVPEDLGPFDLAEWRAEHEKDGPTYNRDGEELDSHERVLLPATDPVPHYNRGRTYIEPRPPWAVISAGEIELEGGDVMLQELSVGDPIEIEKQTGPLSPGIWVITEFQADDRSRARVRKLSVEEIQAARRREANARIYE